MTSAAIGDLARERRHRKERLAAALRLFAQFGFDEGAGGHITARDPERPDHFWINPIGRSFSRLRVSDLILVDEAGRVVTGEGRVNPAGFAIHSQVHAARQDVVAAAHSHSIHGRAWATLGRHLDPVTQDACAFYGDHAVYESFSGVVLDLEEGKRIARTLEGYKAVILQNHGLLTVGGSVDEAAWWFVSMESCCRIQLLAEAAGQPRLIAPEDAKATYEVMGTARMARLNFRPLYERIIAEQPDLLD